MTILAPYLFLISLTSLVIGIVASLRAARSAAHAQRAAGDAGKACASSERIEFELGALRRDIDIAIARLPKTRGKRAPKGAE